MSGQARQDATLNFAPLAAPGGMKLAPGALQRACPLLVRTGATARLPMRLGAGIRQ
jgi:lysylphosphatidylglycerol synthetase-like protein (DUF2156 family)